MRKLTVNGVIGVLVLCVMMTALSGLAEAATTNYRVQPGESLWKVARKFNTSVNNLKKLNNNWSNKVRAGQTLRVPAAKTNASGWVYSVKRGDTIWKIAKKVGLTTNRVKQANGLVRNTLKPGQRLWIPTVTAAPRVTKASYSPARLSSKDVTLLARIVHAEARGEKYTGQVAVASVLLNRLENSKFPKTLSGVVFQKGAFETVANGQIWLQPNATAYRAVRAAINGWDPTYGALYFYNPHKVANPYNWIWTRKVTLKIGKHSFAA